MPVLDHAVHESVIKTTTEAGCHNRKPFAAGYYAKDGWDVDPVTKTGVQRFIWIPHGNSTKCRQRARLPECAGCTAPKDVDYLTRMQHVRE